jgi:hypothetical protein
MAGRYDNPTPESTLSPESGTMNLATGVVHRAEDCSIAGGLYYIDKSSITSTVPLFNLSCTLLKSGLAD